MNNIDDVKINSDNAEDVRWIQKHSINCYFCGILVDERICEPADKYNNDNGGDICPDCLAKLYSKVE